MKENLLKLYGQALKLAIVAYLVVMILPESGASETASVSVFVHSHRILLGAVLFLGFVSFYIIDALFEYWEIHRREVRERNARVTDAALAKDGNYATLPPEHSASEQELMSTAMKCLVRFGLSFALAVGSLVAVVMYEAVLLKVAGLLTFAIAGAAARVFWIEAVANAARHENLSKSIGYRQDLEAYIAAHRQFGLYLHDFGSTVAVDFGPSRPYVGSKSSENRPSEKAIVAALSELIPIFAFHSSFYPYLAPTQRFIANDDSWHSDFDRFSAAASVLIVDAEVLSPGLQHEVRSIINRDFGRKTILMATRDELRLFREQCPGLIEEVRWLIRLDERTHFEESEFKLPDDVLLDIQAVVGGTATEAEGPV